MRFSWRNWSILNLLRPAWRRVYPVVSQILRRARISWMKWRLSQEDWLYFMCNVCGASSAFPRSRMGREQWSCTACGSTVRFRSVIHALSVGLFGKDLTISNFPNDPSIRGIGMSDWNGYAVPLGKRLDYLNTYYHQEPYLDIMADEFAESETFDFVISSDVLEHVPPPVEKAFRNIFRLLKPGGLLVLTVPYVDGATKEHFPGLANYRIEVQNGKQVLVNTRVDGLVEVFSQLVFHGGPGSVVEMRLFGETDLIALLEISGFTDIHIHGEELKEYGILWNPYDPEKAPYRPIIHGLDTPPITARRPVGGVT